MKLVLFFIFFLFNLFVFANNSFIIKNPTSNSYYSICIKTPLKFKNLVEIEIIDEIWKSIPYQFEKNLDGNFYSLWILDDFPSGCEKKYIMKDKKKEEKTNGEKNMKNIEKNKEFILIENGKIGLKIPTKIERKGGPIGKIMLENKWIGESLWSNEVKDYYWEILSEGPIFFKILQKFKFKDGFSEIIITLFNDKPYIIFEEKHQNAIRNYWELNLGENWQINEGYICGWFVTESEKRGPSPHPPLKEDVEKKYVAPFLYENLRKINLTPPFKLGDTITFLEPRWTQNCDKSWFFGYSDGRNFMGIIPSKPGKWLYPYDNSIEVRVISDKKRYFVFPSYKGSRYFYLIGGKNEFLEKLKEFTQLEILHPLNEIQNKYFLEWENKDGTYVPIFFFSDVSSNPTGSIRAQGRNLTKNIRNGKLPSENINTLSLFQQYIDPDFWGYPYNGWSPINPNFYTDFIRIPISLLTGLKSHPLYPMFLEHLKKLLNYHLSASIIMPKGAGTECPGYLWYALTVLADMDEVSKILGIELLNDERIKSAISFLLRTTQPIGNGQRKILPMGDTHPPGPTFEELNEFAIKIGVNEDFRNWQTEEFPGFGIVFRNNSGSNKETFFAFKSGPSRGHYHGDQLAFHYCAYDKRIAIDHMCGYSPRADQEHMHNRVFFSLPEWKYANMDGYERIIGFKKTKLVDIGIGQVESNRLRWMPEKPEEIVWQARYPERFFEKPIIYRRYVIFIKSEKESIRDYFVIWDRFNLPSSTIMPNFAIHVECDSFENVKNCFKFADKLTLLFLYPYTFKFERFDWKHERKKKDGTIYYREKTIGLFISPVIKDDDLKEREEIITVLYPLTENIPQIRFNERKIILNIDNYQDEIIFRDDDLKTKENMGEIILIKRNGKEIFRFNGNEIDLNRNQGEGFYPILEAGYNFGEIPDFLKKYINFIPSEEFYKLKESGK
ncbi:MAG: heparinase II/III-family protein [bacterium]|nr:heparinase II/III-family protein [bacterium]